MLRRPTYTLNPQDVGQPKGIGISVVFNNDTSVFNTTTTTKEQVKSNLINYILTNKGERLFDPTFGGDLRASLFEPDTSFDSVAARLENEIYAYIPNIIIFMNSLHLINHSLQNRMIRNTSNETDIKLYFVNISRTCEKVKIHMIIKRL